MFRRGAQRTHHWFPPAEFEVLHSFVDVKQDIAQPHAFDVDDGAVVFASLVDLPPDDDGVFALLLLFLLDRLAKLVGERATWSTFVYDGEKNERGRALTYHNCWKWSDKAKQLK